MNIHSVIQAPDGRRMSKSLGTGIDPLRRQIADVTAADAVARSGCSRCRRPQDVRFNEERVKQGRDLANKLWNASRLILLRVADVEPDAARPRRGRGPLDRVAPASALTARVTELFDGFRFSLAALDLYGGFWSELCDWYLELAKPRLYEEDNEEVSAVLLWSLERILRLLHPVMPFVTEEIWSLMPGDERGLLAVADVARRRRVALRRGRPSASSSA